MNTVYTLQAASATGGCSLPYAVVSFYRWLYRWFHQTGDVHPSTPYLARKQRKTERTIYRWIALLRDAGWIAVEVVEGVQRRIVPLVEPPARPRKTRRMSGVCQGSVSGVTPYRASDALDAVTTNVSDAVPAPPAEEACPAPPGVTAPPSEEVPAAPVSVSEKVSAVADDLVSAGVPQGVAVGLVLSHGDDAAVKAIEAYRSAKNVRNPVGWLIKAVQAGYQNTPQAAVEGAEKARKVQIRKETPRPVNGLTGRAAFESLRDRLGLAGRVSP